jgi:hypothetical protein
MRAHFRAPVTDSSGNLLPGTVVTIYQNGTTSLLGVPVYSDGSSGSLLTNPFTTPDGNVSFYLDTPQRVDIQVAPPGQAGIIIRDIDVEVAPASSITLSFPGTGTNSTAVGLNSAAAGSNGTAFGNGASAAGPNALAVGQGASATVQDSVAVGQAASATGTQGTAVGDRATVSGAQTMASLSGPVPRPGQSARSRSAREPTPQELEPWQSARAPPRPRPATSPWAAPGRWWTSPGP